MDKKFIILIIGVALILGFLLIRSCQPATVPTETPQVPTLAQASSATPTQKAQFTKTPSQPTSAPTIAASPTSKPKPTNTSPAQPNSTVTTAPTLDPIQLVNWEWITLKVKSTGEIQYIPDPEYYTIVFFPDGTVSGKADCNTYQGTYSRNDGFTIKVTGVTRVACEPDSLETEFLDLLKEVVAGGPDGRGGLALETAGGEKRLEFENGGPAQ